MSSMTATQQQVRQRPNGDSTGVPRLSKKKSLYSAPTGFQEVGQGYLGKDTMAGESESAPLVYQDRTDFLEKRRRGIAGKTVQRTMMLLKRNKRRLEICILVCMFILGIILAGIMTFGAYLLWREEKCRFPDVEYSEEFVYRIDHTLTASSGIVKSEDGTNDSVIMAMGPKLDLIEFMAEYGSAVVTAVETDEGGADIQTVRIIVNNRARSLGAAKKMTNWEFEDVTVLVGEGAAQEEDRRTKLRMKSNTNNTRRGAHACQRADIEIILPAKCLLADTTGEQRTGEKAISRRIAVHVEIDKAQSMEVREEQRVANVKQLSLINTNGPITVQGATGEKLVFKTGDGTIDANNLSGHQIFLSGGEDGALVHAADVRLESGDANCREGVAYKDGFPQTEEYGTPVMICDTVPGVLTIDSEGAENGGDAAVTVREVYGGDVRVSIRVGNVDIIQTACTTFVGEYDLLTGAGSVGVRVDEAEIGTYLVDLDGTATRVKEREFGLSRRSFVNPDDEFFFWDQYDVASSRNRRGEVCIGFVGVPEEPVHVIQAEAVTTGNITLILKEPFVPRDEVE